LYLANTAPAPDSRTFGLSIFMPFGLLLGGAFMKGGVHAQWWGRWVGAILRGEFGA